MKIKIFYLHKDIENYENEINKFIKKTKVIDIKHSISSYGMSTERISYKGMNMSTLIMYEEMEGNNADDKECNQVDNSNRSNCSNTDWSN